MKNTSVELETVSSVETQKTSVKVRHTAIKFFNEETNAVDTVKLIGKMSSIECKKHIQGLNKNNVLISKTNEDEEFLVDTIALYALKGV